MLPFTFTTKHLLTLVIALIAGICWTSYIAWGMTSLALAAYLNSQEENRLFFILLIISFFFFGITRYYQNRDIYFADSHLLEKPCNATCTIQEILPRLDDLEQICILIHISSIEINEVQHEVSKKAYLFLPHYLKLWLKPHQKIILKNIQLKHPRSASYQEYLIRENVWAVTHQKYLSYTTIKKPHLLRQYFDELCAMPLQKTTHAFSQLTHCLYLSIFCGKKIKSPTTTKMKELFQCWGISHHLARSGLHLILLIGLLLFFLSLISCTTSKKQFVIVALLCIYYATTYPSVAFMRAFYMYLLYVLCKQLYLPSNPTHILLVTTLMILSMNPHHLFFLDFQLSFGITLLILWFCQATQNMKTVAS